MATNGQVPGSRAPMNSDNILLHEGSDTFVDNIGRYMFGQFYDYLNELTWQDTATWLGILVFFLFGFSAVVIWDIFMKRKRIRYDLEDFWDRHYRKKYGISAEEKRPSSSSSSSSSSFDTGSLRSRMIFESKAHEWYSLDGAVVAKVVQAIEKHWIQDGQEKKKAATSTASLLEIGCGESLLCQKLYDRGYHDVTCIDFSITVVEKRRECRKHQEIKFLYMDARHLDLEYESYDIVFEKATFDYMVKAKDGASRARASQVIDELVQVLRDQSIIISISTMTPKEYARYWRHEQLKRIDTLRTQRVVKTELVELYIYILRYTA